LRLRLRRRWKGWNNQRLGWRRGLHHEHQTVLRLAQLWLVIGRCQQIGPYDSNDQNDQVEDSGDEKTFSPAAAENETPVSRRIDIALLPEKARQDESLAIGGRQEGFESKSLPRKLIATGRALLSLSLGRNRRTATNASELSPVFVGSAVQSRPFE